jgi:chromosome segregation ATPase
MLKWIVGILGVLLIGSLISNFLVWGDSKEKIAKAENDLQDYKTKYNIVVEKGDSIENVIAGLQKTKENYKHSIDSLEHRVDELKIENKNYQAKVADLFQPDELVNEMREVFPQLKKAPIGIARVPHPETGFMIRTFQVPVQFVATFISDHEEVDNFKKQMETLGGINSVYKNYVSLQDSIIELKEEKAAAYKDGLDYGLTRYEELMKEYISTLKNPPKIEWPSVTSILAAGAVGVAAGVLIGK